MVNPSTILKERDQKILQDMKEEIKKLPLEERVRAVALFRQAERLLLEQVNFDVEEERLKKESYNFQLETSLRVQQIVEGSSNANSDELEQISSVD